MLLRNALTCRCISVGGEGITYSDCVRACADGHAAVCLLRHGAIASPVDFDTDTTMFWVCMPGPPLLPATHFFRRAAKQIIAVGWCRAIWQALEDFFAGAGAQLEKRRTLKWALMCTLDGVSVKVRLFTPSDEEQRLAGAFVIQGELHGGPTDAFHGILRRLERSLRGAFLIKEMRERDESLLQEF